jgi:hypothetical protein
VTDTGPTDYVWLLAILVVMTVVAGGMLLWLGV